MRSSLGKSPIRAADLDRYTPSTKTPTEGSTPALLAPLPNPRIMKFVLVDVWSWLTRREGTTDCKSFKSRMRAFSIVTLSVTDTETGVSCKVVALLVAVTIISSPEVCANAGVMSDAVRAVVTAKMERRDAIDNSPVFKFF